MPFYEYKCECDFEELVSVGATEAPPCPDCGSTQVEKLISLLGGAKSDEGASACGPSGFT